MSVPAAKHSAPTKGPWTIGKNEPSLKSFGKMTTYEIGGEHSAVWNAQVIGEADARLIAAAPDLLEALQAILAAESKQPFSYPHMDELKHAELAVRRALGEESK